MSQNFAQGKSPEHIALALETGLKLPGSPLNKNTFMFLRTVVKKFLCGPPTSGTGEFVYDSHGITGFMLEFVQCAMKVWRC